MQELLLRWRLELRSLQRLVLLLKLLQELQNLQMQELLK